MNAPPQQQQQQQQHTLLKQLIRLHLQSSVMKATFTRIAPLFVKIGARHQDDHICCFCSCSTFAVACLLLVLKL
jgi:hypothetical protein